MRSHRAGGFTLVEVLVALMVVAMGLAALMVAVSGTARTSGYLRDKTLAQWIAMNRLVEVRLNASNKFAQNVDTAEVDFAGRKWHYDTKYFNTSIGTMKRVVVRVYAGDSKAKGNPIAESTSFLGTAVGAPGSSNPTWVTGAMPPTVANSSGAAAAQAAGAAGMNQSMGAATPANTTAPITTPTTTPTP